MQMIFVAEAILEAASSSDDFFGELLRGLTFKPERAWSATTADDLRPGFEPAKPPVSVDGYEREDGPPFEAYQNRALGIYVAWRWDGDGVLYFATSWLRREIWNTDCKKPWGWQGRDYVMIEPPPRGREQLSWGDYWLVGQERAGVEMQEIDILPLEHTTTKGNA